MFKEYLRNRIDEHVSKSEGKQPQGKAPFFHVRLYGLPPELMAQGVSFCFRYGLLRKFHTRALSSLALVGSTCSWPPRLATTRTATLHGSKYRKPLRWKILHIPKDPFSVSYFPLVEQILLLRKYCLLATVYFQIHSTLSCDYFNPTLTIISYLLCPPPRILLLNLLQLIFTCISYYSITTSSTDIYFSCPVCI